MSAGTICWLISIAINLIICILFCTSVYLHDDDKKLLPVGVSILIVGLGLIKYVATVVAVLLIIAFLVLACEMDIYFDFKNKFLNDLFTR